jgi:hypothetical protein
MTTTDIGNWTFESTHDTTVIDWIPEGTSLNPSAYYTYTPLHGMAELLKSGRKKTEKFLYKSKAYYIIKT